jgi:hypothetical protein
VLTLFGIGFACARRSKEDGILLSFLLLYYLSASLSAVRFARYMIPLFPVFCVLAARLISSYRSQQRYAREWASFGALVILLTAGYTVSLVRIMGLRDPRDAAADYLEKTTPNGASVAFAKIPWFYSPPLSTRFGALSAPARALAAAETTRFHLLMPAQEWDTAALNPPPDYIVVSNIETMHPVDRLHLEAPTRFVRSIPGDYARHEFAPSAPVFNLPHSGVLIPEDLLYILPRITVYQKPQGP